MHRTWLPKILLQPCHLLSTLDLNIQPLMGHLYFGIGYKSQKLHSLNRILHSPLPSVSRIITICSTWTLATLPPSGSGLNHISRDYLWFLSFPHLPLYKLSTGVIDFFFPKHTQMHVLASSSPTSILFRTAGATIIPSYFQAQALIEQLSAWLKQLKSIVECHHSPAKILSCSRCT